MSDQNIMLILLVGMLIPWCAVFNMFDEKGLFFIVGLLLDIIIFIAFYRLCNYGVII